MRACVLMASEVVKILLYSGSRAGKTFIIVYFIIIRALKAANTTHLFLRQTFSEANFSLINQTIPNVFSSCFPEIKYDLNKSEHIYRLPNGSELWVSGLDTGLQVEKILGTEFSSIYLGEVSQMQYESVLLVLTRLAQKSTLINKSYFDCNPPTKKHWSYKLFILNIDPITREPLKNPNDYGYLKLFPDDNKGNLADGYIENTLSNLPPKLRKRFLEGDYADEVEGALWTDELINNNRVSTLPAMIRCVVAIDPSITANSNSDECGIVVCGKGYDGHFYVIQDYSGINTPAGWGRVAVDAYNLHGCDAIVCEVNQGGDLVKNNILNINNHIRVVGIHANKGKLLRAEPIQGLYENGLVHHLNVLDKLEYEMETYDGKPSSISPNRLDAMVYGVTLLMENSHQNHSTMRVSG
jgi:phage terminase large subunit-like protein